MSPAATRTGTLLPVDDVLRFLERVSPDVLVVLDEAYNEYLPSALKGDSITWLKQFPNLLITRTFSKAYGMAGVRVGFGLAHPEVAGLMNRVRQPFNVNNIGLAGAVAALQDEEFVKRSYALNQAGMLQIVTGLRRMGISRVVVRGGLSSDLATVDPRQVAATAEETGGRLEVRLTRVHWRRAHQFFQ